MDGCAVMNRKHHPSVERSIRIFLRRFFGESRSYPVLLRDTRTIVLHDVALLLDKKSILVQVPRWYGTGCKYILLEYHRGRTSTGTGTS